MSSESGDVFRVSSCDSEYMRECNNRFIKNCSYPVLEMYVISWNITTRRLHSSSMHTTRLLTVSPSMHCTGGVPGSRGSAWSLGVPALEGRGVGWWWYPSMHWGRPPCEQNSWQTLLKILPCPKLRLWAVNTSSKLIAIKTYFNWWKDTTGIGYF